MVLTTKPNALASNSLIPEERDLANRDHEQAMALKSSFAEIEVIRYRFFREGSPSAAITAALEDNQPEDWGDFRNWRSAQKSIGEFNHEMELLYNTAREETIESTEDLPSIIAMHDLNMIPQEIDDSFVSRGAGPVAISTRYYVPGSSNCTSESLRAIRSAHMLSRGPFPVILRDPARTISTVLDAPESSDLGLQPLTILAREQPDEEQPEKGRGGKRSTATHLNAPESGDLGLQRLICLR